MIPVIFSMYGGADRTLVNSVEMLQANNIMINTTTDEDCEFLRQTVADWVTAVGIHDSRRGNLSLHLLHLTIKPLRCDVLNQTRICLKVCEPHGNRLNCDVVCEGWAEVNYRERLKWYEDQFDVRPNDVTTVVSSLRPQLNYSLPNGTVVEDTFFVEAHFNETVAVKMT